MKREDCEKAILKHLIAIADIYKKYNPIGDYLSIYINNRVENGNGCEFGNWDTRRIAANNLYWGKDKGRQINFTSSIDIVDSKYHSAMDKFYEEYPSEEGLYPIEWDYFKNEF